jgi:hypothetical protein
MAPDLVDLLGNTTVGRWVSMGARARWAARRPRVDDQDLVVRGAAGPTATGEGRAVKGVTLHGHSSHLWYSPYKKSMGRGF